MKLKYYLRGIGIGIVITTFLFMIFVPMHRNDKEGPNTSLPPQGTESKTVAQLQEDTQKLLVDTETVEPASEPDIEAPAASGQNIRDTEEDKAASPVDQNAQNPGESKPQENQQAKPEADSETPAQPEPKTEEKVRIEISSGQYSDLVCKKLEEAGLIDSAKAFNDYLVQKNYDNFILPGVYEIAKGSTYEEIALLLITKVE